MKRNVVAASLLTLCFTLSGCFGIEEKILIHKDGSGVFTYTLDVTEMMKQMMEMVGTLEKAFKDDADSTSTAKKEPTKLTDKRGEMVEKMKEDFAFNKDGRMNNVKGISDYREFVDTLDGKLIIGLSFGFNNVNSLNSALKTMFAKSDKKKKTDGLPPAIYGFKNGELTREVPKDKVEGLVGNDNDSEAVKKMMKGFKYVVVVEADEKIQTVAAPGAVIEKNGKTVVIDYQVFDKGDEIIKAKMKSTVKVY